MGMGPTDEAPAPPEGASVGFYEAVAGVTAKRFTAADWDRTLPAARAAEKAGAPIAWLGIARMSIEPT